MTRPTDEFDLVAELRRQGLGYGRIAEQTGIPKATVANWVKGRRKYRVLRRVCPFVDGIHFCAAHVDPSTYAYLLGVYLGDGYIVRVGRAFALHLYCDVRYSQIIESWRAAVAMVRPNRVRVSNRGNCAMIAAYSTHWTHLFPQHGPGMKHTRPIVLEQWQRAIVETHPKRFIKGLIESDGCRATNKVKQRRYSYTRYLFANESKDILRLFGEACDRIGVEWQYNRPNSISIARRASVELLDEFVGPKR
jgi:hypothetical protein